MRIATFNLQNLRLRAGRLTGARDGDTPDTGDSGLDRRDREIGAQVIRDCRADIVILQEVFDAATLDHFHDAFLRPAGVAPYPHRICLPGNDGRGQELAVISRIAPEAVVSHAGLRPADLGLDVPRGLARATPVFRRDCLRVDLARITLFACHFKAPYPEAAAAWAVRRLEARAVRALIEARFADAATADWLILGDFNDPARRRDNPATAPLLPPFSVDLLDRVPGGQRWSYHDPWADRYSRSDRMLASPALARACPDTVPDLVREGLGLEAARHTGAHLPGVGHHRPHASDHAALVADFPGF